MQQVSDPRTSEGARPPIGPIPGDALVVVPVRNMALFPGLVVPIAIGREASIAGTKYAIDRDLPLGILMQHNPQTEVPGPDELASVGTVASVLRDVTSPDGSHHIICQGQQRFRVTGYLPGYPFIVARIERVEEHSGAGDKEIEARFIRLKERAVEVLQLLPQVPAEMINVVQRIEAPGTLADLAVGYLDIGAQEKQQLLEEVDLRRRLDRWLEVMVHKIAVMHISREIDQQTKVNAEKREREFLLREQMGAIQKALGEEGGGNAAELDELRQLIADACLPEELAKQAEKALKRLQRMSDGSSEYSMVRTYLDWLPELPWKTPAPDVIDVAQARTVLEEDHFGLGQVKKRIIEFLAVRKLKPDGHGPILCLVGPPGVGKTSLGQSIAKALGRKFVRVSLGGVHDEAALAEFLGPAKFENEVALRTAMPGVATGLAWTPVGGDILFIVASRAAGAGRLILTGRLGVVMKESVQAALTLVKSRTEALQLDAGVFEKTDIHVHVPAGAIPKDGPSAGVAMFTDKPVHNDIAMTGEISLRGLVLPVGGIKEKVLAAVAAGIKRVMLPSRNRKDLEEVPQAARQQIELIFLDNVEQAMQSAIGQRKVGVRYVA